ncbi:MAG: helix-turn-helix domain-containing protein [Paracoccaceae bacterium]
MQPLLKIEEAARRLGVPKASLRTAAEKHGLLVRMGRAVRIDPNDIERLIEKCRDKPQGRASTGEKTRAFGSSETPDDLTVQRARATAARLKGR